MSCQNETDMNSYLNFDLKKEFISLNWSRILMRLSFALINSRQLKNGCTEGLLEVALNLKLSAGMLNILTLFKMFSSLTGKRSNRYQ